MAAPDVEYRCFVGGLAWATDDRSLEAAFSTYGEILESKIINDRETGRSRGFGFVTFSSEQAMRDAIEGMNGKELDGRNITVNEAQSRRSGGGGGGGFEQAAAAADTAEAAATPMGIGGTERWGPRGQLSSSSFELLFMIVVIIYRYLSVRVFDRSMDLCVFRVVVAHLCF
uniref:RRM domain-containing protein n=1 Tax=Leersia perrieri TaxID=77586 RepID=A0A0D9Y1Q9_9ORYZ